MFDNISATFNDRKKIWMIDLLNIHDRGDYNTAIEKLREEQDIIDSVFHKVFGIVSI